MELLLACMLLLAFLAVPCLRSLRRPGRAGASGQVQSYVRILGLTYEVCMVQDGHGHPACVVAFWPSWHCGLNRNVWGLRGHVARTAAGGAALQAGLKARQPDLL